MQKWEYLSIADEAVEGTGNALLPSQIFTANLNAMGVDGWELITVMGTPAFGYTYFFKRPLD